MKARKWNYSNQEYEDYELPEGSILYTYDLDEHCKCAACGADMIYGKGYSSLEIEEPDRGLGYCICADCQNKERERREAYRKKKMKEERCENCKYFSELAHNFEFGEGFDHSFCCTLFANENYVVEVAPDSMCEEFTAKGKEAET